MVEEEEGEEEEKEEEKEEMVKAQVQEHKCRSTNCNRN